MKLEIKDRTYYLGMIISIAVGIISTYAQSKDPQTGLFLFLALAGAIFLYFLVSWPINFIKKKIKNVDDNSEEIGLVRKDLNSINEKLNFKESINMLDKKIYVIEEVLKMKNKRGQIDPRIILIIIIIVLFFLYLKSKGWI